MRAYECTEIFCLHVAIALILNVIRTINIPIQYVNVFFTIMFTSLFCHIYNQKLCIKTRNKYSTLKFHKSLLFKKQKFVTKNYNI